MKTKPLMSGEALIEIERNRYDELLKTEERIGIIKKWLATKARYCDYADVSDLKLLLDVKERIDKND